VPGSGPTDWALSPAHAIVRRHSEEAAVERLRTGAIDGRKEFVAIVVSERTDFNPPPIAERFNRRIPGDVALIDGVFFTDPFPGYAALEQRVRKARTRPVTEVLRSSRA
jgi:hypothetical protein